MESGTGAARARILVLDDMVEVADAIAAVLSAEGHEVLPVSDEAAAREAHLASAYDVAILDLHLGAAVGDGTRLAADLAADEVSVILMSGWMSAAREMARLPYPYLVKPFRPPELRRTVEAVLAKRAEDPLKQAAGSG